MVAATGVLIAAIYYIQNMRAAIKKREAQLFMQIFERFREKDFWEGARAPKGLKQIPVLERPRKNSTKILVYMKKSTQAS